MAGNLLLGLSEAKKLVGSGKKNHTITSRRMVFRAETKKTLFHYIYR